MPDPSQSNNLSKALYGFGYEVMGPILAECCHLLHNHLISATRDNNSQVLYCARGGLVIRRALALYLKKIEFVPPLTGNDLMVSRLAAARLALTSHSDEIAPLLALEFDGRSCAEVATALSGEVISSSGVWAQPYTLRYLFQLLVGSEEGQRVRQTIFQQAELFRDHFTSLLGGARTVYLVDTGMFGSIGHFLTLGLPNISINSVLLFRANYKKEAGLQLPPAIGLVCNKDQYCPWEPRSVSRLYWPFLESFFEPELPSVRTYRREANGNVLSNLEIPGWLDRLSPALGSIRGGAFDYLAGLNQASVSMIPKYSDHAWQRLRRLIIYPRQEDLAFLGVSARGVDFGFNDVVSFGEYPLPNTIFEKIEKVRASLWPEGEIRRLFPCTAGFWFHILEAFRTVAAIGHAMGNRQMFGSFYAS